MKRVVTRLASMAGVVVLTAGLSAMADSPAYGSSQPHQASRLAPGLARLDRLARTRLFPAGTAAGGQSDLGGVDVRARDDGWAVGSRCTGRCASGYTLIEHWNGRRWSRVPSPNVTKLQALGSVRAVSARNAWAVGIYLTANNEAIRTLIEHWNGRRWSRVSSPNPSASPTNGFNVLGAVTAVSARDVWAAGFYQQGNTVARPLLMHWDGARWSVVPSPRRSSISTVNAVTATSARNAWAVGSYGDAGNHMLLLHWDGVRWSLVPGLRVQGELNAVTAVSARDVWAAGTSCPDRCGQNVPPSRALLLHWDGVRWAHVASPEPSSQSELLGVAAASARDAWAVGDYCQGKCPTGPLSGAGARLLLLHWNGVRWARFTGPRLGRAVPSLDAVSALSGRRAVAVGTVCSGSCGQGSVTRQLILGWNGRRWRTSAG